MREASWAGRHEHASLRSGRSSVRAPISIGASTELKAVAAEIAERVRVLDGLVRYRFGDNAELMGAWASARNVLGPFKRKGEPGAGGSETLREAQGRPPKAA